MTQSEESPVALLLIDVMNGFDFEGSEGLVEGARRAAPESWRCVNAPTPTTCRSSTSTTILANGDSTFARRWRHAPTHASPAIRWRGC